VKPGMTVLDIGANIGFYTVLLARLVGSKGRVFSFEPDPENFRHLVSCTRNYPQVVTEQCAVGSKSGTITLYHSRFMNVDHRTYQCNDDRIPVQVQCITIDEYIPKDLTIDFIKLDVQGYEYNVLLGAQERVRRSPTIALLVEYWPYGLATAGIRPNDLLNFLEQTGLHPVLERLQKWESIKDETIKHNESYYTDIFLIKKESNDNVSRTGYQHGTEAQ
jgi:FkbM family methyltransferase